MTIYDSDQAIIHKILPRRSILERQAVGKFGETQIISTNIDVAFIMVNAKEFVFVPRTALPSGMSPVNLSINQNYIKFQPDLIDSYMPFFGNAYSGVVYSTDKGLKFIGKPESFTVEKNKNAFQIYAVVKGETDIFRLSLSVGFEGNASLLISSNNRSTISYAGEISAPEKAGNK
jgi:hypothetical protein